MDLHRVTDEILKNIFIEMESSGRHVHVTKEQAQTLFGHGLSPERPLSQPGQWVAKERVTVVGPKGEFKMVAVLGPERKEAQVEISLTDGRVLGIRPPVRACSFVTWTCRPQLSISINILLRISSVTLCRSIQSLLKLDHNQIQKAAKTV